MFLTAPSETSYSPVLPIKNNFVPANQNHNCNLLQRDSYFTPKSAKTQKIYTARELVEEFLEVSVAQKQLSPKTEQQCRQQMYTFLDLWLLDDLNELDRENAELFRGLLYKMPKNPSKNKRLHGYKGIALLKRNEELGGDVISRRTVKSSLTCCPRFMVGSNLEVMLMRILSTN